MYAVYLDTAEKSQSFELNGYSIKANLAVPMFAPAGGAVAGLSSSDKRPTTAGGIVFATAPDQFIVVGKDFTLSFTSLSTDLKKPKIDVAYMDDGSFINNKWVTTRRLNGDEGTGGGDYGFGYNKGNAALLRFKLSATGDYNIVKFKLYRY
jgi:hypothetical protein